MDLPTAEELDKDPGESMRRLRRLAAEIDEAEMTAIVAWLRRGGTLSGLASRIGVSRQSLNQRMQRRLKTREPTVILKETARLQRKALGRRQREEIEDILSERDRRRAAGAAS